MSKEAFKTFAKAHPEIATSVLNNQTTWQKLYELYEIYGEDSTIWNNILNKTTTSTDPISSFKELFSTFKNIDLNSVQSGITNLQKTLGLLQELGVGKRNNQSLPYEPRPLYQYFED